tara:strand:+ start:9564 stop:10607 length:1044 start_codon:yes stop_codon:yes gene_type:complete
MKYVFFTILIFSMGCLKQSEPVVSEKMIYIYPTLDSAYDLALQNDTLYVANGELGIKALKVVNDGNVELNSLYEGIAFSEQENIIDIELSQASEILFALDKFNYTSARYTQSLFDDAYGGMVTQSTCYNYQSKSTVFVDEGNPQVLTLNRKIDQFDEENRRTSIGKTIISNEIYYLDKDCSQEILSDLNYGVTDLNFNNGRLYLSNANKNIPSIQVYDENVGAFSFAFEDTLMVEPITIRAYENSYVVGLDDKAGCYIALLDADGNLGGSESKLYMADGFTIRHIHYSNNLLVLSAGYGGALVYDWDGESMPTPRAMISSGYAYSALVYDNNKIIVGTQNGIEIYEI